MVSVGRKGYHGRSLMSAWLWFSLLLSCGWLSGKDLLDWDELPPLPDREGFAGVFAGVVGDEADHFLVVAGGANFPDKRPWEQGSKEYYARVFVLPLKQGGEWREDERRLPMKAAYGMSVGLENGKCLFMGGENAEGARDEVMEISLSGGKLSIEVIGALPKPITSGVAALVEGAVLVGAGGDGERTHRELWQMRRQDPRWIEWKSLGWPGEARGRVHSVGGVRGRRFYLFGGRDNAGSDEAAAERIFGLDWLKDCWELDVEGGIWRRLADLPEGRSAAPSTALPVGAASFLILGGVTVDFLRSQLAARPELNGQGMEHPGFSDKVLSYDVVTDRWAERGEMSLGESLPPVTTPVVFWEGQWIIPSGEIKPGVRTPGVLKISLAGTKVGFGFFNWTIVLVYLGGMVAIGYWFMNREAASTTDDYFRGGQRVPFWVAGLSIFATMLSAITFMTIPGAAYAGNWNMWLGQLPIVLMVLLVMFFYLPFYRRLNITTAYEYLEKRFNVAARVVASVVFILFHLGRVAIVLYLPAIALASVTNINVYVAIGVIGVLCVIYTVMGGIEAVVWTDAIQALVLLGGALLCFGLVVTEVDGGLNAVGSTMAEQGKGVTANWGLSEVSLSKETLSGWVIMLAFFFANLPSYTVGQDVVQRYVTTPSEKEARKSLWLNIPMVIGGSAIFFALGTAMFVFYQEKPDLLNPALEKNDTILPFFIMQNLPVGVAGLIISGIFAASQSTISSSLNSVATTFVTDVYGRLIRTDSGDQQRLGIAKRVVIILGVAGIVVAAFLAATGLDEVFKAYTTFIGFVLGPLGGLFALGVFTKRPGGVAGLLAMVAGVFSVICVYVANELGVIDLWPLLYGAVGFLATVVAGLLLGLVFRAREEQVDGLTIWSQK